MTENTFCDIMKIFLPLNKKFDDKDISERKSQLFEQLIIFNMIVDSSIYVEVDVKSFKAYF